MKISTTKKAAILATVLSGFVLGSSAEAANLGVVTASDYATSHMGALQGSFIHSDDIHAVKSAIIGLNRDPAVYNTIDPVTGKSSIYIRQYNYSTTNLQNSYAFDAQGKWDVRAVGNTSKAVNAHDVARYKDFVYVASYDEGTVGIAQVTGDTILDMPTLAINLKQDLADYEGITYGDSAQFHGEGVVIVDGSLYVIANVNPYGGYKPYDGSYLMKYVIQKDGSLKYDGYTQMGKNTDSVALNVYNNYILTTAIGGYQNYGAEYSNAETSLNVAMINPDYDYLQKSWEITLPENLKMERNGKIIAKSEFRSLKVMPNGTAYVMTYNIGRGGDNVDVTVYQTTVSNLLSKNPVNWQEIYQEEAAPGWFGRLDAEYQTKRLWVQVGNKLNIYTDGSKDPISLGTQDFTTSPLYNELYTWDIIRTDVIPEGKLVKLKLAVDEKGNTIESKYNPNALKWKVNGTQVDAINNSVKTISTKDNVINLGKDAQGNLTNNVLAGIYAKDGVSNVTAYAGVQIQVENNIATPVGIFAGENATVKLTANAGNVNILTKTLEGGNTLTNAIWLDPSKTGGESITVESLATNITMEGGYGGNGVAIQKTDRWGENSKASTKGGTITIKGDLNIKGADNETWGIGANPENVLSRFNNAGILVDVNNSSVTVDGNVDMDVYGNGVTVTGDNSTVTIKKGGSITVPQGTKYGYYALAAYDGTINMNADATANAVKIDGDIFALKGATVNLGLATNDSYLKGIIDNGGTANLTLKNGATWTNLANNTRYGQDNEDYGNGEQSKVTLLTGGDSLAQAGTIIQTANSKLLEIDKLSGAVHVKYYHDASDPTSILGGDVKIAKATEGSNICLITNGGFDTANEDLVNQVLDSLANKLYYTGYASNPYNLKGIVGIGEGLTASSITKIANIKFDAESGQGSRSDGTGDDDAPIVIPGPAHPGKDTSENYNGQWQTDTSKSDIVIGNKIIDRDYVVGHSSGNMTKAPEDLVQTVDKHQIQAQSEEHIPVGIYQGTNNTNIKYYLYGSCKESNPTSDGVYLPINIITEVLGNSTKQAYGIWVESVGGQKQRLQLPYNDINITMIGGNGGYGIAITEGEGSEYDSVGNKRFVQIGKNLSIKGKYFNQWGIGVNKEATDARENSSGILVELDNSYVEVKGSAYMDVCGNGVTVEATNADDKNKANVVIGSGAGSDNIKGSQILVPEGDEDHQYYSLAAYEGKILVDNAQNYTVAGVRKGGQIDGDWYIGGEGASIDLGLNGTDAHFNGAVDNNGGTANLYLVDGATWTNLSTNGLDDVSHITNFRGNNKTDGKAAQIIQYADSGDIVIDNYYGDTRVYYTYQEATPHKFQGGDIKINHAEADSKITLHTGYSTAIQWGNLETVMNGLASKLYYLGAISAENGGLGENKLTASLQIGEGMTASAIKVDDLKVTEILDKDGNLSSFIKDVEYKDGTLNGKIEFNASTGKGSLGSIGEDEEDNPYEDWAEETVPDGYTVTEGFRDANGAYTKPIYGVIGKDLDYIATDIRNNGVYTFNEDVTFNTVKQEIDGGAWHQPVSTAISAHGDLNTTVVCKTTVDMKGNNLTINNIGQNSSAGISAIDNGVVVIDNPGNITLNEQGYMSAGIFANSGGEVYINNADGGKVTIRTASGGPDNDMAYKLNGAGIKTMNGIKDVRSKVVITGLVDIVADLETCCNEAISAVASSVDIGGGNIQAINGAWAAIRAYGEFVSENTAVVNVNVIKQTDAEGNVLTDPTDSRVELIAGAGDYKTTIIGDFVTNGGMGTRGHISVGLNGEDSYWNGNYGDTRGYGVTQGMEGQVSLFMKNGANWTGFGDGQMNVTMEGEGTTWYGFNLCDVKRFTGTYSEGEYAEPYDYYAGGMNLNLLDGAMWINAISTIQKNADGTQADSLIYNFNGVNGFIDMTGNKTFLAINDANHDEGSNGISDKNTGIVEYGDQYESGNMVITNYSGDTTVIYKRDDKNITEVLGGTTTIKNATLGSKITLSTDGYGILNNNQVAETLDNLAEKLYYTAYVNGERNLKGYVQIAEGLTTSSVGKHVGNIDFNSKTGQGSLNTGNLDLDITPPSDGEGDNQGGGNEGTTTPEQPVVPEQPKEVEKEFTGGISGDFATDETYKGLVNEETGALDFGKLEAAEGEVIGSVKIETEATADNNTVISSDKADKPVIIDMAGLNLEVNAGADKVAKGIEATNGAAVTISNAGNVTITANAESGSASAIYAAGTGTQIVIDNANSDDNLGGTVKLEAKGNASEAVLQAKDGAVVDIKGVVDITETDGNVAVEVGKDAKVNLGGGEIGNNANGVAVAVENGGKVAINKDTKNKVVINGDVMFGMGTPAPATFKLTRGVVANVPASNSITLNTNDSKQTGDVVYGGVGANQFTMNISNRAQWTGNSLGGVDLNVVLTSDGVWTGYHDDNGSADAALRMTLSNGAEWRNTAEKDTILTSLTGVTGGKEGFIRMETDAALTVKDYSGETTFLYDHNGANELIGGNVTIENAADGSIVNVRTNSIGTSDKEEVTKVLKALAAKMIAGTNAKNTLKGEAQIAEGIVTSASALKVGSINFANGTGELDEKSITAKYDDSDYIYGDSETAMMKGAKSAMASTVMMWRSESNDLLQRMGDVRLATEESGVWAKYYGGKYEMDAQNTNFSTNYKAYQVGYDKTVGNGWNVGVAVSHNEGDSRYDRGGEGEMTVTSLSVYGNKDYGDGRYLGLILKGSQLKNEYEVFNNDGYKLEGDFKTWGTSISAEYGKRIEKGNGFYFDPSVELTVGHVQGKDYTATSDMLAAYGKTATMQVEQDNFNSIIGRVGFGIGQRTDKASYYAKLALAHEFGGDFDTNYTAEETKGTNIDFGDTWYEMQLGGTAKLSDNSLLYATYERSFGGDVTEKWRVDAGLRVTF